VNGTSEEGMLRPEPIQKEPGVGYVIGQEMASLDPVSELEMAKRKELVMLQSLKRRAEHEARRISKEAQMAKKRAEEQGRKEEAERKKEEERLKREAILADYRSRKEADEVEKQRGPSTLSSSRDSGRGSTLVLHRSNRPRSAGKPRPVSLHMSATNLPELGRSRVHDDMSLGRNSSWGRPGSRGLPSPNGSRAGLPSLPPSLLLGRHRGPGSDAASECGSTWSDRFSQPKLFVQPTAKSNRGLILNALSVVLAGVVNLETKKKVVEMVDARDSKHFLVLFRGAGMQFRAIYSYNPDTEEVYKLHGTGPKTIHNDMIDKFYK